ncbi:YaaC family protein [Paenibacillus sp. Y412MC10]|uniref:YaaC family protein n=1 Tax=Geobacillus sp. (strain Y412MC10) TaxID=481743 RepID=UPI00119F4FC2|nr:YaaC family protein [Paenibacillus sp. Y412MC10]
MTIDRSTIKRLRDSIQKNSQDIKAVKEIIKIKAARTSIKKGNNEIPVRKAVINPNFSNKTVLTDSTWHYVELFLKSHKENEALNYWHQAENFFKATQGLDMLSKPLTSYYCFLNATKALLTFRKVGFNLQHGVSGESVAGRVNIQNEQISIHPRGVLSGLCNYLNEPITHPKENYTLKDVLYNLEFIHRAYNMTYSNQPELFIPVEDIRFVHDKTRKVGWLEVVLEPQYSNQATLTKLEGFSLDNYYSNSDFYVVRRNKTFYWDAPRNAPTAISLEKFKSYYSKNRKNVRYIFSPNKLWYIKRTNLTNGIINKSTLTLIFAAMHRLSEMSRYDPNTLDKHLSSTAGWLLSEFITKSAFQFIDMISSEVTGDDFRVTGFRT